MKRSSFVVCVDENYLPYLSVCLKSFFAHHRHADVYVMNPGLPLPWFSHWQTYLRRLDCRLIDVCLSKEEIPQYQSFSYITGISYAFMLFADRFPEIDQFIYFDCDGLVEDSLEELTVFPLPEDVPLAAVRDWLSPGFNSGFLVINAKYWRKQEVWKQIQSAAEERQKLNWPVDDQSLLNHVFQSNYLVLPDRYNAQVGGDATGVLNNVKDYRAKYDSAVANPAFIHYSTVAKPWRTSHVRLLDRWWDYALLGMGEIVQANWERKKQNLLIFLTTDRPWNAIREWAGDVPEVNFHIASRTLVSQRIWDLHNEPNITVHPGETLLTMEELFRRMDMVLEMKDSPLPDTVREIVQRVELPLWKESEKTPETLKAHLLWRGNPLW